MGELSLSTLAKLAEVIGASTIVTGLIFGWIQLRQYRVQQRDAVATNLMQAFYSRDLAQVIALLQTVPDGIRQVELRARGEEYVAAAVTVTTSTDAAPAHIKYRDWKPG